MKANKIHSLWIMLMTAVYTVYACGGAAVLHICKRPSRTWCDQAMQYWSVKMLKLFKVNLKIINPYKISPKPKEATIIICNHASLFDIPLSISAFPKTSMRMLAKKELSYIPIFGQGIKAAEFVTIDRKNRAQSMRDFQRVKELLQNGIVMWIAPEGGRSKDGKLLPFKKSPFIMAIEAGAKIIPIGIRGANNIIPHKTFKFYLKQKAEVHIGKPIDAAKFTLENKEELISLAFTSMKKLVGEEVTC
jgi:1-acyl-sn-glycerol-3-phosphate acyltransferase